MHTRLSRTLAATSAMFFASVVMACDASGVVGVVADAAPDGGPGDGGASPEAASASACPSGRGPAMVKTPFGCIDTTEVTQSQYAQFLDAAPSPAQPAECSWNTTFVPGQQTRGFVCSASLYDPLGRPHAPVRCVDWCDAVTFCAWAGKRLCGAIGGGPVALSEFSASNRSQWMATCTGDRKQAYPYGVFFTPDACHGTLDPLSKVIDPFDVASAPSCIGGSDGVHDMSGNVSEWEDSCDGASGEGDRCRVRGGGIHDTAAGLACDADVVVPRGSMGGTMGFRCCAN